MSRLFNKIAYYFTIAIFAVVILFGIVFSSNYDFADFPYFELNSPDKLLYLLVAVTLLAAYMLIGRLVSWNIWVCFIIYAIVSVVYIIVIPLEPFSDMKNVYDIATNGMRDDYGYLSVYNNQIPVAIYMWLVTSMFGRNIIVLKIFNIICNIVTLYFIYKIYLLLGISDTSESLLITGCKPAMRKRNDGRAVIWFASLFIPVILYVNHLYNDILFTVLTTILVYLVLSGGKGAVRFSLICALSIIQFLIRPSGIIYIIAIVIYYVSKQPDNTGKKKNIIWVAVYIAITACAIIGITRLNKAVFEVNSSVTFPVWSYIQMGINEEEFGFQDGTHSADWTLQDCIDKYRDLGIVRVLKIWVKKELWMWSEGTYQAERYGFGDSGAVYTYGNRVNESLRDIDGSFIRNVLEKLMKAQYYIFMLLAMAGLLFMKNNNPLKLILYVICGFFFFYLIWEIKSRYIFSLWPFMVILAYEGMIKTGELLRNNVTVLHTMKS